MTTITLTQRRAIRKSAGEPKNSNLPIEIITGVAAAPRVTGDRYWKTNFTRHYPSGKCFSKTLYTASTRRVIVGEQWLAVA